MSDDFRLQHSIKTNSGDMLNVRGATPAEFETALAYAENNIERIVNLGALARAVGTASDAGLTAPQQQPAAPAQQPQASNGWGAQSAAPGPQCAHGAMVQRSGNKNGRSWSGYFCPTPKGTPGQCEPQFGS